MAPSEDLVDEVEAINSIYGNGTLVLGDEAPKSGSGSGDSGDSDATGTLASLAMPTSADDVADADLDAAATARRLSLRLWFPPAYPASAEAPAVLGVLSGGGGLTHRRPGAAAHDAERFGTTLTAAFRAGEVCVFDAVEEFLRLRDEEDKQEEEKAQAEQEAQQQQQQQRRRSGSPVVDAALAASPPPWTLAEPVVELKSTFLARCAPVTSPAQAAAYIQHLKDTDKRVRTATHNMTAWRIRGRPGTTAAYQDCDDDGETAAGGRLLHLMQLMDLWNVVVVVTRWYGGHKLGPRRFALINQAARDAFVRAGLVPVAEKKRK